MKRQKDTETVALVHPSAQQQEVLAQLPELQMRSAGVGGRAAPSSLLSPPSVPFRPMSAQARNVPGALFAAVHMQGSGHT